MGRAQSGDRVATVEYHPTDRTIQRINTGTVTKTGAHGAHVRFDDPRLKGTMWIQDSKIHFITMEGHDKGPPLLSRSRPPSRKLSFGGSIASSIAKQEIHVEQPAEPEVTKTDPLDAFLKSGGNLLDLWEALGKKVIPAAQAEYDKCVKDTAAARSAKADADALVNKLLADLRIAEQMATEAKQVLHDAENAEADAEDRLDRAKGNTR